MIKYTEIKEYNRIGPLTHFSHYYLWRKKGKSPVAIILIKAYHGTAKVAKGYQRGDIYIDVPITEDLSEQENIVGKLEPVSLGEMFKGITGYEDVVKAEGKPARDITDCDDCPLQEECPGTAPSPCHYWGEDALVYKGMTL